MEERSLTRSGWNSSAMLIRGFLTDKKVEHYRKQGYYSEEWRSARRELWARRAEKRKRRGNFLEAEDGRLIYSPL